MQGVDYRTSSVGRVDRSPAPPNELPNAPQHANRPIDRLRWQESAIEGEELSRTRFGRVDFSCAQELLACASPIPLPPKVDRQNMVPR